jgi:L-ascorbate metabolism protein UlaG (beta-lactamase superfamily)
MKFTYYGHSCFLLETGGKKLLFDPFISQNELAKEISIDTIEADYILVSHGHQDHTADLVFLAKKTNATVICGWEIMLWLEKQGVKNLHSMNIGGKAKFDFGNIKVTFAAHSSSLPDGTYGGTSMGFLILSEGKTIYYSGDTGLSQEMKLIGEFNPADWAIMPIGGNFTMDAEDATIAANFIKCDKIIGIHYDTFEPIKIDHFLAKKVFSDINKELFLLNISETIQL